MQKIIITFIIMLLTLSIHAQTSVELRTHQNPKIEELLKYAESMGKDTSVFYTSRHKSVAFSVYQYTDFNYTMTGDSIKDAWRKKMNKEYDERRMKEALLIDSIRNTFMELANEADGCYMWEYHQDGVDSIDYKMTLGAYSNKRIVISNNELRNKEEKTIGPVHEIITFYYKPDNPEFISNEYHTNKGFGSFQYQLYPDSIFRDYEQIDTKEYVNLLGDVMKKNGLKYRKLHAEMDSTYDLRNRKEIIDYNGYTKGEQCMSDIKIYESVPKEKGQEVLKELIDVTWTFMDMHPTADLSLSLNDMFKKGWNSPIIIRNDYKKEGRESCSIQIRYLEDKDEYCFLIYDVKGGRVLPKEWQTLKSWKNGKKVYYRK